MEWAGNETVVPRGMNTPSERVTSVRAFREGPTGDGVREVIYVWKIHTGYTAFETDRFLDKTIDLPQFCGRAHRPSIFGYDLFSFFA